MAIPTYPELGKQAREIFRRGYHPGLWQLDCKTKTSSGIEFLTTGFASQDATKVKGALQSKYKIDDYGLTLTERWNTDNMLYGEIMQREKLAAGLMLALEGTYKPESGDKGGKFKLGYAKDKFNFLADMNISKEGPLNASIVFGIEGFLLGGGLEIKTDGPELTTNKIALGWSHDNTVLHAELKNLEEIYASVFHKLNDKIDLGFEFSKVAPAEPDPDQPEGGEGGGGGSVVLGLGGVYHLNEDAQIRAKINTNADLGLGYEQKLREGITFSVSTVLECKNIKDGNHKFGIGFSLEC